MERHLPQREVQVIDPDGFDRSDASLYERRFTREEFKAGAMRSTCRFGPEFLQRMAAAPKEVR